MPKKETSARPGGCAGTEAELILKIDELTIINEIDRIRDTTKSIAGILAKSLSVAGRFIKADYCAAFNFNEKTMELELAAEERKRGGKSEAARALELAGKAIKSKKDVLSAGKGGGHTFVIPIVFGEKDVFGAVAFVRKEGAFTKDEKTLLHAMESQLDSALEHARVYNKLLLRNKELGILYRIDEIRDAHFEFDEMLSAVLAELTGAADSQAGFIVLFDLDGKERVMKVQGRLGDDQKRRLRKISSDAIRSGKMFSGNEAGPGLRSVLCTPLILGDKIIGTFGVVNPREKKFFDTDDERLLLAVASQADTAIFEDLSRQKIKDVFKRYVNEKVVDQMLKAKTDNFLTGKRLNMSVLFADMRGFTAMSEKIREPEKLVEVINEYLAAMTEVVMKNDGTLDKFVGDEVMALFGAPLHYPAHAKTAIRTAIEMQKEMDKLCRRWKRQGKIPCRIGIGINTGDMVAGNIGCEKVTSYTVLGDNVNLGARLCSAAKPDQILLAEATYKQAKGAYKFNELEPIMVKGKSKLIRIYEVVY